MTFSSAIKYFASAIVLTSSVACTSTVPPQLTAPNGFAQVKKDNEGYQHRVFNAHGVVVGLRSEKNELKGTSSFWASALDQRFRRSGYTFEKQLDVKSIEGLDGRQLRYRQEQAGRQYRYWVTVFANEKRVFIVEAGGDKEFFDPIVKDVSSTIQSIRTGG